MTGVDVAHPNSKQQIREEQTLLRQATPGSQEALVRHGETNGGVDGVKGPDTKAAEEAVRKIEHLSPTEDVGSHLARQAIENAAMGVVNEKTGLDLNPMMFKDTKSLRHANKTTRDLLHSEENELKKVVKAYPDEARAAISEYQHKQPEIQGQDYNQVINAIQTAMQAAGVSGGHGEDVKAPLAPKTAGPLRERS